MPSARNIAIQLLRTLRNAGFTAYFAGGCVRDELLGLSPKDYDIATSARPEDVRRLFRRTNEVGASFGVMLVRESHYTIEVTTFREEGAYSDKRRPDDVRYADAPGDARRRDFTINALFLDPLSEPDDASRAVGARGLIIDYVGGIADLRARIIRAVGNPADRLAEDHLRALRAVRFASRLGFSIDEATADAIRAHAQQLEGVSRERIGDELRKMLTAPTRAVAVRLLEAFGLDEPTLREPPVGARTDADPFILAELPQDASFPLALAAWGAHRLILRADAPSQAVDLSPLAELAGAWRAALCLSNEETGALKQIIEIVQTMRTRWLGLDVAARKRLAAHDRFSDAQTLFRILDPAAAASVDADVEQLRADGVGIAPAPLISGDDLIRLGCRSGPTLGALLRELYDDQLTGQIRTSDEAESRAKALMQRAPQDGNRE